ncbi:MAG: Gldg family protein [Candidatus Obscuribacterales bacterium]|nr:Gldg family protein [Candidatus Obscuribacterales bacterium]
MNNIMRIARREFAAFFSSVTAFLFLGAFLFVTLFVFFWVDPFFARNIADARPMFEWMPALLILLVPALTMRMWSEERRAGTLELLMTAPVTDIQLVTGKFLACLGLVAVAVTMTFQIPMTVALLGALDLGPVVGGYIATLFLAGAYIAIGLFVSSKTDNQIVSLLLAVLLCGIFLIVGSDPVTNLFNVQMSEILKLLGSGSRFQSITRGVIDFRDLYYYLCLMAVFLTLNVLSLERLRWASNRSNARHRHWIVVAALVIANAVAANFWLQQVGFARVDLTEGQIYTISNTTRRYLMELKEPLLIRGYFSKKTHPLLAPLVPRLRDLLHEYAIAGNGKVKVEFIDPLDNPDLEREAGEKYGIKPVVFQTASKYQAAVVNSYFDVLIKYGDQYETLSFRDLIEVKSGGETDSVDVELRNPEYDITSAIKKVLSQFRSEGNLFVDVKDPVVFKGYVSDDANLPPPLVKMKSKLLEVMEALKKESKGKLSIVIENPDADGGRLGKQLEKDYGFKPMALGLFDSKSFWFYMMMESGGQVVPVAMPQDIDKVSIERSVTSTLKRFSKGFMKTVGVWTEMPDSAFKYQDLPAKHFMAIREKLASEFTVKNIDFQGAKIATDIDVLILLAPDKMKEKELFAIDQFLMRGGTVILSTSPFDVDFEKELSGRRLDSGMIDWLKHYGINTEQTMILDPKNSSFPIPMERELGDYVVQETRMVPYPYFVDVRSDGMDKVSGIMSGIHQLTVNWPSPLTVDETKFKGSSVIKLLYSSPESWTSDSIEIQPDFKKNEKFGFEEHGKRERKLLACAVEGQLESYYKGKKPPEAEPTRKQNEAAVNSVVEKSTGTSRLIVFSSNAFLSDEMLQLATAATGTVYLTPISVVANAIDWALGDRDLLTIRGRGHFSRPLTPLPDNFQMVFEYANYGVALFALFIVWVVRAVYAHRARKRYLKILDLRSAPK